MTTTEPDPPLDNDPDPDLDPEPTDPPPPQDPGYTGQPVDETPREDYSVAGVTAATRPPPVAENLSPALTLWLTRLERKLKRMEKDMADNQARVDAAVAAINEAVGNVESEVADLKAAVAAGQTDLDFTGLDAAVGRLNASTDAVEAGETPPAPVE